MSINCSTCGGNPGFALPKFPNLLPRPSVGRVCVKMANKESGKNCSVVRENDGVIIVDHGSRRQESNLMLNEFVAMFRDKTGYPIVEPAHMELAEPSIKDAFGLCVQQGANRVIVSPFFLFPGRHWHQDIPSLTAEAAKEHPNVSYIITAPLGLHELLVDVVNDRIKHCVSHVEGVVDECAVCAGTDRDVQVQVLPLQHTGRTPNTLGPNFTSWWVVLRCLKDFGDAPTLVAGKECRSCILVVRQSHSTLFHIANNRESVSV